MAKAKGIQRGCEAWADGTRVYLREPRVGCSSILWVELYDGPEVTVDNVDSEVVRRATEKASGEARVLVGRWHRMTFDEARAEYEAL